MLKEAGTPPRDIHERALEYAVRARRLVRHIQRTLEVGALTIGRQLLRAATSIGANLAAAQSGETRADFVHKCSVAQKEARECLYWLRLLARAELVPYARLSGLTGETNGITAVITAIARNARKRTS